VGGDLENAELEPRHGNGNTRNIPRGSVSRVYYDHHEARRSTLVI
jgi:hypothetical protein